MLATDQNEYPLLDIRRIDLAVPETAPPVTALAPTMAELTPRERLQPSLLDRLTDDEPDQSQEVTR
jgi:hypothetical protein